MVSILPTSSALPNTDFGGPDPDLASGWDILPFGDGNMPSYPDPCADAGLCGPGGFNAPGFAAQNVMTDPNAYGLSAPAGPSFDADALIRLYSLGGYAPPAANDGDADDYARGLPGGLNI